MGAGATAITAVVYRSSPQAIAGVITGIGFIGAGIMFQAQEGVVRGVSTAATIFAAAAIGVVVGYRHLLLGLLTTMGILLTLELRHIPLLNFLDARRYNDRFEDDMSPPAGMQ